MIFERRAYTFRRGEMEHFWAAQPVWNTNDIFGEILASNISYFQLASTDIERIVHLYRFDSLNAWSDAYGRYYAAQSPEYFALVRPMMLAQENTFLISAPGRETLTKWSDPAFGFRDAVGRHIPTENLGDIVIGEWDLQLRPGGLPIYWQAYDDLMLRRDKEEASHLVAIHQVISGRLHRIFRYCWFPSLEAARTFEESRREDAAERVLAARCGAFLESETVSHLRPAPMERLRSVFGF